MNTQVHLCKVSCSSEVMAICDRACPAQVHGTVSLTPGYQWEGQPPAQVDMGCCLAGRSRHRCRR